MEIWGYIGNMNNSCYHAADLDSQALKLETLPGAVPAVRVPQRLYQ